MMKKITKKIKYRSLLSLASIGAITLVTAQSPSLKEPPKEPVSPAVSPRNVTPGKPAVIGSPQQNTLDAHIADTNNPHKSMPKSGFFAVKTATIVNDNYTLTNDDLGCYVTMPNVANIVAGVAAVDQNGTIALRAPDTHKMVISGVFKDQNGDSMTSYTVNAGGSVSLDFAGGKAILTNGNTSNVVVETMAINNDTVGEFKLQNLGVTSGINPKAAALQVPSGLTRINWSQEFIWNTKYNPVTDQWEQVVPSSNSSIIEQGQEGVSIHVIPPGQESFTAYHKTAFQVRAKGSTYYPEPLDTPDIIVQPKAPIYMSNKRTYTPGSGSTATVADWTYVNAKDISRPFLRIDQHKAQAEGIQLWSRSNSQGGVQLAFKHSRGDTGDSNDGDIAGIIQASYTVGNITSSKGKMVMRWNADEGGVDWKWQDEQGNDTFEIRANGTIRLLRLPQYADDAAAAAAGVLTGELYRNNNNQVIWKN